LVEVDAAAHDVHLCRDAYHQTGALNRQRAFLCEVVARRTACQLEKVESSGDSRAPTDHISLSKRFVRLDEDGDESLPTSAMESAADQNCVIFLSSSEAQRCAEDLWKGKLTQEYDPSGLVFFKSHHRGEPSFLGALDATRLAVPQYSYYAGLAIHVALIVVYTFSTLEYTGLDSWEIVLWIFAAGYLVDDLSRWFKMRGLDKINSFWVLVDLSSDALFTTAFVFRATGWLKHDHEAKKQYQLLAFQFLSCIAPLLWMQLLKLADGFQYFGVIQIVLLRMLQETAAFFLLLLLTGVGFAQSFFALDAADGRRVEDSGSVVVNMLAAAILGSPDFDTPRGQFGEPFGVILFYIYTFIAIMLLANILVAFFSSAYDKTVDDATDVFRAYFCSKVVSAIRAPDQFVYLPPFNLVEAFLVAPFEPILPTKVYAKINKYVQGTLYCIPLLAIALYESQVDGKLGKRIRMEMMDDLPEERVRRLKEACGLQGTIEDPSFEEAQGNSSTKSSGSLQLTREQFAMAAKSYAERASQDTSIGAQVYAQGWKWTEGSNSPYTAHLSRTFSLPSSKSSHSKNDDTELLDSMAVTEEEGGNGTATGSLSNSQTISVTQSICYSSTWKVPVLYLEASDADGSPLSVEALCSSPVFMSKGEDAKSDTKDVDGLAVFPTVSIGENPGNGHNSAYLHPCETAKYIATLLEEEGSKGDDVKYIESFVMLCSSVVEMRPGSKGGLGQSDKITSYKGQSSKNGQDMDIATMQFADLVKQLPNVKVS
jgi:hypothetical protein